MSFISPLTVIGVVLTVSLLLTACSDAEPLPAVGLANPASAFCIQQGGRLEIVRDADGEKGLCYLPDGHVEEEWALFRRMQESK